ncbi:hypothetical protein B0T14DRAFT_156401 [Immersiella caudata]|uniref:Uncharacterized protein n=1 Tax=Immersiella caudata TaxID=314043 RepID=A0AA39WX72_9PEZI|nr:hypothetical protein B0T14DRAFT_156401 [Immersiella caudata]
MCGALDLTNQRNCPCDAKRQLDGSASQEPRGDPDRVHCFFQGARSGDLAAREQHLFFALRRSISSSSVAHPAARQRWRRSSPHSPGLEASLFLANFICAAADLAAAQTSRGALITAG